MKLVRYQVVSGNESRPRRPCEVEVDGERALGIGHGNGPVDAALKADGSSRWAVERRCSAAPRAVTAGKDALAEVVVAGA